MIEYKRCEVCKINKEIKDYLINKEVCYKCIYLQKIMDSHKQRSKYCKECKVLLPNSRWAYCSPTCSLEAKKKNRHWTQKIKMNPINDKNWKNHDFRI